MSIRTFPVPNAPTLLSCFTLALVVLADYTSFAVSLSRPPNTSHRPYKHKKSWRAEGATAQCGER
jgi:hypothetical protein